MSHKAKTLYEFFVDAHEKEQYNQLSNENWAPDLVTLAQKDIRAKNRAIRGAAINYMRQDHVGFDYVKPNYATTEERAHHYGVAVGAFLGYTYKRSKDYYTLLAQTIKRLRKEIFEKGKTEHV
jgi:hypothetical protein